MNVTATPYKSDLAPESGGAPAKLSAPPLTLESSTSLSPLTRLECSQLARSMYPSATIVEAPNQGRCSYTLLVPDNRTILQFRPPTHRLDLDITAAASAIFPDLAPATTRLLAVINPATAAGGRSSYKANPDNHDAARTQTETVPGGRTLLIYSHTLIDGVPLSSLTAPAKQPRPQQARLLTDPQTQLASLVRSLARDYFARSYYHASPRPLCSCPAQSPSSPSPGSSSSPPPPSRSASLPELRSGAEAEAEAEAGLVNETVNLIPNPDADGPGTANNLQPVVGKRRRIGFTLRQRMEWMREGLPDRFSSVLKEVWGAMDEIERGLPWVLTHGDLGEGNVLVDVNAALSNGLREVRLKGLVDWAEGEWLPFGVGLYGLEEILGRTVQDGNGRGRFEYYPCAEQLRAVFWDELVAAVPELGTDRELRARVGKARVLGLLLWHGIAFDDGALNRVVEPGVDDEELQKLDLFLLGIDRHRNDSASQPLDEAGILDKWPSVLGPAMSSAQLQGRLTPIPLRP